MPAAPIIDLVIKLIAEKKKPDWCNTWKRKDIDEDYTRIDYYSALDGNGLYKKMSITLNRHLMKDISESTKMMDIYCA